MISCNFYSCFLLNKFQIIVCLLIDFFSNQTIRILSGYYRDSSRTWTGSKYFISFCNTNKFEISLNVNKNRSSLIVHQLKLFSRNIKKKLHYLTKLFHYYVNQKKSYQIQFIGLITKRHITYRSTKIFQILSSPQKRVNQG